MGGSSSVLYVGLRAFGAQAVRIHVEYIADDTGCPKKTEFQKFSDIMIFIISGPSEQFWAPWANGVPWAILGHSGDSLGQFGPSGPLWAILGHSGPS